LDDTGSHTRMQEKNISGPTREKVRWVAFKGGSRLWITSLHSHFATFQSATAYWVQLGGMLSGYDNGKISINKNKVPIKNNTRCVEQSAGRSNEFLAFTSRCIVLFFETYFSLSSSFLFRLGRYPGSRNKRENSMFRV